MFGRPSDSFTALLAVSRFGQGCQVGLLLAYFQKFWPRFKLVGLLAFFGFISSWLTLKNMLGLLALFWLFYAEIGSYEGKYCCSISSATHLQNFFDKCYVRRPHFDISNI